MLSASRRCIHRLTIHRLIASSLPLGGSYARGDELSYFSSFAAVPAAPGVLARARRALLDLLFPPRCVICRQTGRAFCPACLSRVQPAQEEALMAPDSAGSVRLSGIRSAGIYRPPLSVAIREFKYRRRTDLAPAWAS